MSRQGRAIVGVALIGVGVAIATGWWWPAAAEEQARLDQPVRTVEIDNDSGDVTVVAADVSTTTVKQIFDYSWGKPDDAFELEDGVLKLTDCGWNCTVNYEVVVPKGTEVRGEVDSAVITLDGVAEADVHADSGDIVLRDIDGPVRAEVDSGEVRGVRLGGPVDAHADSGDVHLDLSSQADVKASADSGDVVVEVPPGEYDVQAEADSGDEDVTVRTDPDSEYVLEVSSDSGEVGVHER